MSQQSVISDKSVMDSELHTSLKQHLDALENNCTLDLLNTLCGKYLTSIPQHQIESLLLGTLSHRLQSLFDSCLEELLTMNASVELITTAVQNSLDLIGCVEQCLVSLISRQEAIFLSNIPSIPPVVIHIVKGSLSFCKKSNTIYDAKVFEKMSNYLTALFQQTSKVYKQFLEIVLQATMDETNLPIVLNGIHEIYFCVSSLDTKLMISSLKAISKLTTDQYHLLSSENVNVILSIVSQLSDDIIESMEDVASKQSQESDTAMKYLRIVAFKLKVLSNLVEKYTDSINGEDIYRLIQKYFLLELKFSEECHKSIEKISCAFQTSGGFCQYVLTQKECSKTRLLVLLEITKCVSMAADSVIDLWMDESENRPSLFMLTLSMVKSCGPNGLIMTKKEGQASLYEQLCCHLSTLAARVSSSHFKQVEKALIEMALSTDSLTSLLATDIWAFLGRYSTVDVCQAHCVMISRLLMSSSKLSPFPSQCRLLSLLHRLVKFLPANVQEDLLSLFPLSESTLLLWSALPIPASYTKDITRHCIECMDRIQQQRFITPADTLKLSLLSQMCSDPDSELIAKAIPFLLTGKLPPLLAASLLGVIASYSGAPTEQMSKVDLADSNVAIAMISLLETNINQPSMPGLNTVFRELLSSSDLLVSQLALQVFADYASQSVHEAVVQECCKQKPSIHSAVLEYFNQLSGQGSFEHDNREDHIPDSDCIVVSYPSPVPWQKAQNNIKPTAAMSLTDSAPVDTLVIDAILDIEQGVKVLQNKPIQSQVHTHIVDIHQKLTQILEK